MRKKLAVLKFFDCYYLKIFFVGLVFLALFHTYYLKYFVSYTFWSVNYVRFNEESAYRKTKKNIGKLDMFTDHIFNPEGIYNDCDMAWSRKEAIPWFKKKGRTDVEKSFIHTWDIRSAGQFSRVILRTQFTDGTTKPYGGDYWRAVVFGQSAIPVVKTDFKNGSYEFRFLPLKSGRYYLKISLEYTLCDGIKEPPFNWFIRGNVQGKEQKQGILFADMPYINRPLWNDVPLEFTVPPSITTYRKDSIVKTLCSKQNYACKLLWNSYGSWINKTTWKPICESPFQRYPRKREGMLWIFGDSVSSQFYHAIKRNRLCKQIFRNCMYTYNWVYSLENYNLTLGRYVRRNNTVEKRLWDRNDFNVTKIVEELKQALLHPAMDDKSVVLLNYGLHFTEATNYTNYKAMIERIVELGKSVRCKIVWRTTTSFNRHKYSMPNLHSRRFMTSQRVQLYNAFASRRFCASGYDVLDIYPLTDSYPEGTGSARSPNDPVHYEYHVMRPIEQLLERVFGGG